jgi:murein DD-endopeptidase MepM/ murein hydrolase activator NlpD
MMAQNKLSTNPWVLAGVGLVTMGLLVSVALPANHESAGCECALCCLNFGSSPATLSADDRYAFEATQPVTAPTLPVLDGEVRAKIGSPGGEEKIALMRDQIIQAQEAEAARIAAEQAAARAAERARRAKIIAAPSRARISARYGIRGSRWSAGWHTGLDFNGRYGDPVSSAKLGVVTFTGWKAGYGYTIEIKHPDGALTRYAHLSRISVKTGQEVDVGEQIGRMGATGNASGPHLHFEVIINEEFVNPANWLWG